MNAVSIKVHSISNQDASRAKETGAHQIKLDRKQNRIVPCDGSYYVARMRGGLISRSFLLGVASLPVLITFLAVGRKHIKKPTKAADKKKFLKMFIERVETVICESIKNAGVVACVKSYS